MESFTHQGLTFYRFPGLAAFPEVVQGVFTRLGGVSTGPYSSLNLSFAVGDQPPQVRENRRRVQAALGLTALAGGSQVHGRQSAVIDAPQVLAETDLPEVDILITGQPGIGLLIKQADCQAVMLYDPEHRVAANVHCGWRGQVQNILAEAVRRLQTEFGSRPAVLRAGIGPGLGPCCAEFRHYGQEFPRHFWRYQVRPYYFNLWDISRDQLRAAGLQPEHIDISGLCTKCRESEFFSYRRERLSGRQGAIIGLKV